MKKFALILTLVIVTVVSFAAEYKHPGWFCEDNVLINTQYQIAKEAGDVDKQITCLVLMKFNEGKIKTFVELKDVVATVVKEVNGKEKKSTNWKTIFFIKRFSCSRRQFLTEVWNYCKANPSNFDAYFMLDFENNEICSNEERYVFLVNYLINTNFANSGPIVQLVKQCVEKVIDLGVIVNVTSQKADLQKINRKFSKNLLKDKTAWEPVIAMVRTALETY